MTSEEIQKLKEDYGKYWDQEEINIDLANKLVNAIPKLIRTVEHLWDVIDSLEESE